MRTISLLLSQPWGQQLGWTLIQFFWQGTVISILFAVSRRLLGRTLSAHARYFLACGTLAAMTAAPVLTFFLMPGLTKDVPPLTSWPFPSPDAWQPVLPWLVALWLSGVVVFSARLIGQAPAFHTLQGPGAAAAMSLLWLIGVGAAAVHGAPTKPPIAPRVAASQSAAQTAVPAAPAALSLSPISSALLFGPYGPRPTAAATATVVAEPVEVQQPAAPAVNIGMEFVRIPAGSFMMGCSPGDNQCSENEKPAHPVTITKAFDLGKYLVTQGQYDAVMGTNPSHFKGENDLPVEQVGWSTAQDFLREMNARQDGYHYRLPTEAEWEYAARAGTTEATYGPLDAIAWYRANSGGTTHTVGQKQANAWGVYDMIGNVAEWVQDKYGLYSAGAVSDPTGPILPFTSSVRKNGGSPFTGDNHVLRGSSWGSRSQDARMSVRSYVVPVDQRGSSIGFRVVREANP